MWNYHLRSFLDLFTFERLSNLSVGQGHMMNDRFLKIHIIFLVLIPLFLSLFADRLHLIRDMDSDLLLNIRGSRYANGKILFIYLDETDIEALGGWPVTRDYYSYAIHILTEKNASVIGLDILFNTPDRQYPEYDRMLAGFLETSNRVVLPNVLDFTESDRVKQASPISELARYAKEIGFSNLEEAAIQRCVPIVYNHDSLYISFGLALAKVYLDAEVILKNGQLLLQTETLKAVRIPVNRSGAIRINPSGSSAQFQTMRFSRLLKTYEKHPDSLDFTDQLVLIGVTAPSLPVIRSTALRSQIPAALIHATVAENILMKNWLHAMPVVSESVWMAFWMMTGVLIGIRIRRYGLWLFMTTVVLMMISCGCLILFHIVIPFYLSAMLSWGSGVYFHHVKTRQRSRMESDRFREIKAQIRLKENALDLAEKRLSEMESKFIREAKEKEQLSDKTVEIARDQKTRVLDLEKQIRDLKASVHKPTKTVSGKFPEIIHAADSPITRVLDLICKVAPDNMPVLIQGETGTGKELIARAVHQASPRKRKAFLTVNCGSLPESLLDSELFGHEKGAFTGAQSQRRGRFELANGGTIFLDEITETSQAFQARLLRVLQEGTFERVGSEKTVHVDIRVIAAHNKDINEEVRTGRFREDLFFRLNAFPMNLPPLRDRPQDISLLTEFFIRKYQKSGRMRISEAVMNHFRQYRWPGNVRELENWIRRAVLLAGSENRNMIQMKDLPEEVHRSVPDEIPAVYHPLESQILETLRRFRFSHSAIRQTAKALGNKDRGTITEYYRGLCFQYLVKHDSLDKAAAAMSASKDPEVTARLAGKMHSYVENVRRSVEESPDSPRCYKGLPKRFHPYLDEIVSEIREE